MRVCVWYSNFGAESHERRHGRFPAFKSAPRSVPLLVHGLVLTPRDPFTDPVTSDREEVPRKKKARPRLGTSPLAVSSERPTLRLPPPTPRHDSRRTSARSSRAHAGAPRRATRDALSRPAARGSGSWTRARSLRDDPVASRARLRLRPRRASRRRDVPGDVVSDATTTSPGMGCSPSKARAAAHPAGKARSAAPRTRVASASSAASASRRAAFELPPEDRRAGPPRAPRTRARGALVARRARRTTRGPRPRSASCTRAAPPRCGAAPRPSARAGRASTRSPWFTLPRDDAEDQEEETKRSDHDASPRDDREPGRAHARRGADRNENDHLSTRSRRVDDTPAEANAVASGKPRKKREGRTRRDASSPFPPPRGARSPAEWRLFWDARDVSDRACSLYLECRPVADSSGSRRDRRRPGGSEKESKKKDTQWETDACFTFALADAEPEPLPGRRAESRREWENHKEEEEEE